MLKTTAVGRIVKDAQVIPYNNNQGSMVKFTLACNDSFDRDKVSYVDCVLFNRNESTAKYLLQGNQMVVNGDLTIVRNGDFTNVQITVDTMEFGAKKQ